MLFSDIGLTKRTLTDGADWARLQAKAKLSEQTLSHVVGRFLLVRREKKNHSEKLYMWLFCLVLAANTFQADILSGMNFVWWLYAIFHSLLTGEIKLLLFKAGRIIKWPFWVRCAIWKTFSFCSSFESKENYSNVSFKTFILWNFCFKTNYGLIQSASYCFCVSISLCVCFAKIQHLQ